MLYTLSNTASTFLKSEKASRVVRIRTRRIMSKVFDKKEMSNGTSTFNHGQSSINTFFTTIQVTTIQPSQNSATVSARMVLTVIINCIMLSIVISKTPFMREIKSMKKMRQDENVVRSDLL